MLTKAASRSTIIGTHGPFVTRTPDSLITDRENFSQEEGVAAEAPAASPVSVVALPSRPHRSSPPSKAARLPHFYQAWQQVTQNSFILNIVLNGYMIQFISTPIQYKYVARNMSPKNIKVCGNKVAEFLEYKIIKVVTPNHDQFISHIFPVPKKSLKDYRIIFDLSELNEFVRKVHFKMDSIMDIFIMIKPE